MDFCKECEAYLKKNITDNDEIIFQCMSCHARLNGNDDDTLLDEEYLGASITDAIHEQFIKNSPFDDAANIVFRDCKKCGLDFMIKIRPGLAQNTKYTCSCGHVEGDGG